MEQFRFLKWKVYSDAQKLFSEVILITRSLPQQYLFDIGSQLNRSGLSIILNIAEGSGKKSDKELSRFLDIALGSAYETLACLDTLRRNHLLNEGRYADLTKSITEICRQIGGLKKSASET